MISIGTDETSRRSLGSDMVTSDLISITISNSKNTNRSSTNREESSSSADKTLEKGRGESKVTLLSKQQSLCSLPPKTLWYFRGSRSCYSASSQRTISTRMPTATKGAQCSVSAETVTLPPSLDSPVSLWKRTDFLRQLWIPNLQKESVRVSKKKCRKPPHLLKHLNHNR